jgi:hypothetical protein
MQLVASVAVHAAPLGSALAVYPVRVPPFRKSGAFPDAVAVVLPAVAVTPVGACGETGTGTVLWMLVSSPSWPPALWASVVR